MRAQAPAVLVQEGVGVCQFQVQQKGLAQAAPSVPRLPAERHAACATCQAHRPSDRKEQEPWLQRSPADSLTSALTRTEACAKNKVENGA